MAGLNKTILTGRLAQDPEVRYTSNEKPVAHFSLAVERIPGKDGEKTVDFINCLAWGNLAKTCGEYLKKGRMVAVEGRLQIRKYEDKDGVKKSFSEVVINQMQMLDFVKTKKSEE
jgi:single-strand DNA-binding protein